MKNVLILAGLALCLAGCNDTQPTHTVDWYKNHDDARAKQIAACKNNPGEKALTPNCVNATKANEEKLHARRGFSPLPKMKW